MEHETLYNGIGYKIQVSHTKAGKTEPYRQYADKGMLLAGENESKIVSHVNRYNRVRFHETSYDTLKELLTWETEESLLRAFNFFERAEAINMTHYRASRQYTLRLALKRAGFI